jgi:AmiR/NasT family two-component response regulator
MASRHVREDEAFMILKMASHNSDRRVRELAAELVTQANLLDPSE